MKIPIFMCSATATSSRGNSRPCSCCILTSSCCPGGGMVARTESGSLKQWSMEGFEQADVGCVVVGGDGLHSTRVTSDGIS